MLVKIQAFFCRGGLGLGAKTMHKREKAGDLNKKEGGGPWGRDNNFTMTGKRMTGLALTRPFGKVSEL